IPEYLRTAEDGRVVNFMDYGVPLGRRFRALKLWFIMRYYGHEGLAAIMRSQIALAKELSAQIEAHPCFELAAPTVFSVLCFRYKGSDEQNRALLDRVNASGEVFLSHTALHGKFTIHLSIGNMGTTRAHVQRAWQLLQKEAEAL
ncbi:MAG TPA: pyridoxal-dependent decarboxylase, partial [Bryobacteraceae bacterium]|nr:pyridoxal-dependent decarboxylase [Bryobacteraceae bacterium]